MKFNQAEFIGNQLFIKGNKSPIVVRITLIIVLLICLLIPIAITITLMSERKGPHFGIFLSFIFFWGIGFYMLRIILWNTFGREVLTFEDDKISYEADYRYFRDGKTSISTKDIEVVAVPTIDESAKLGILIFTNENQHIDTVLRVPFDKMTELAAEVNNRY
ncbi:hypothetical protein AEQU3_03098 [Aequorivita antarctica]|nr:hypothetical protein AEQU3_03098 [Aequorivita antarctica]